MQCLARLPGWPSSRPLGCGKKRVNTVSRCYSVAGCNVLRRGDAQYIAVFFVKCSTRSKTGERNRHFYAFPIHPIHPWINAASRTNRDPSISIIDYIPPKFAYTIRYIFLFNKNIYFARAICVYRNKKNIVQVAPAIPRQEIEMYKEYKNAEIQITKSIKIVCGKKAFDRFSCDS